VLGLESPQKHLLGYVEYKNATFLLNNRLCKNFSLGFIHVFSENLPILFSRCWEKFILYKIRGEKLNFSLEC
jgi:hypothetical protein